MMPHAKPWEYCKWPSPGGSNACVTGFCTLALVILVVSYAREQRQFRGAPGAVSSGGSEADTSG